MREGRPRYTGRFATGTTTRGVAAPAAAASTRPSSRSSAPPPLTLPDKSLLVGPLLFLAAGSATATVAAALASPFVPTLLRYGDSAELGNKLSNDAAAIANAVGALDLKFLQEHDGCCAFRRSLLRQDEGTTETGGDTPVACVDGAWNFSVVRRLRRDAKALRAAGIGSPEAGVASQTSGIRTGVHQIWLQSPLVDGGVRSSSSFPTLYVGDMDARRELVRAMNCLRESLQQEAQREPSRGNTRANGSLALPPHLVELSYLLYDGEGASYAKHLDCPADDLRVANPGRAHRRAVSFLLYLGNDDDDDEEYAEDEFFVFDCEDDSKDRREGQTTESTWDPSRHGGALRIHGNAPASAVRDSAFATSSRHGAREDNGGDGWADLAPLPGRMVLFDSSEIWHEVRPTLAPRYCVVGWFRTPIGS